jgi:hypothetical protein
MFKNLQHTLTKLQNFAIQPLRYPIPSSKMESRIRATQVFIFPQSSQIAPNFFFLKKKWGWLEMAKVGGFDHSQFFFYFKTRGNLGRLGEK